MENINKYETQPTEEELSELRRKSLIRGISQDIAELISQKAPAEDMEKIIGKEFMKGLENIDEVQNKITEGLKECSFSELENITMRIETYKKLRE